MTKQDIINSPSASKWLKAAIQTAERRDILDALRDAEALVQLLQEDCIKAGFALPRKGTFAVE
tara:strand:+ start:104 stop:292 length:189 start_codon:yes stop_codon:yes gene_type:complete